MPYIKKDQRDLYQHVTFKHLGALLTGPGDVNYVITQIVDDYLGPVPNYAEINAVIGALECAKLELYRRVAVPYEDKKITENGDVYQDRR